MQRLPVSSNRRCGVLASSSCAAPRLAPRPRAAARRAAAVAARAAPQQTVLSGSCYEEIVEGLAARIIDAAVAQKPLGRKYIVGIAGAPGSGKSTLAALLRDRINRIAGGGSSSSASSGSSSRGVAAGGGRGAALGGVSAGGSGRAAAGEAPVAVVVPMDGFHLYKRQLDAMPDPEEAYARRGAHWTFDADAFVACVRRIRESGAARVPSFDHGVGDPVDGDIAVDPATPIVIVEGNYLFLDLEPWRQLRALLDEAVFVDVPLDTAMDRVYRRQVALGLAPDVSRRRIAGNDRPNGELVAASAGAARVVVPSSVPLSGSESD
ncbi:uridine kinase [Raphidocelis subcapitata]|uniref:Uridine kinase n=1 Tax=Raphidocelis subcapitata TaxID=307507 RepID=A0A2V0NSY4_9CHLO|nr:uridine kinase [Raphidocelis subcapitata]|eukprot:GBF88037.1 uridine kinase [Raphidocelis subcapitata]